MNYLRHINSLFRRLMSDERGITNAFSIVFLTVFLSIGCLVGLGAIRNHVVQEFGDMAVALDNVDQSFSVLITVDGEVCWFAEYRDDAATLEDPVDSPPACLVLNTNPVGETGDIFTPGTLPRGN